MTENIPGHAPTINGGREPCRGARSGPRFLALSAAKLGQELRLPLADSVILATARAHHATLWTQDADFQGLDGVRFIKKKGT